MIRKFNEFRTSLALRQQALQMLASVESNITAVQLGAFQNSEAENLLNQSFDEYDLAKQLFQSKNYTGVLQHARKALDLIQQAQLKENQYQQQLLATRIAEIALAVAVPVVVVGAAILHLRKRAKIPAAAKERPSRGVQFCINCGAELPPNSKFCNKCGSTQT
jgi:ribosomal protein L40E